jgi:TetR/AcrR family transcriptional regulator, cholesterol catabolism regulator
MPRGVPLTDEEQARRRREILDAAVRLFFEKGFTETSMRAIAEATGSGKSTLYDYFKTKDDILVAYFDNEIQEMTRRAQEIQQQNMPAEEKLRQVMVLHLEYLIANKNFYLKLSVEAQRMGLQSQMRVQANRHAYQDLVCRLVEEGIAEGTFRPVDPFLTMRLILSALTPVVFTTRPSGSPREMFDAMMDILLKGIQV